MNNKKTIIHFIYSLGRGGAETMLVRALSDLKEYNNIVVTLYESNQFEKGVNCKKYICLHSPTLFSLVFATLKFKAVVKELKPDLIHSHLPLCDFVARLAVPKSIPLVTTIHTSIASADDYKKWYIKFLDAFTYKLKKSTIIAVSKVALDDYFTVLKINPNKTYILNTFADPELFNQKASINNGTNIKAVCIGSFKSGKNYEYLVKAFKKLKDLDITLHIYGNGAHRDIIQNEINGSGINIVLKGQVSNIQEILPQYDLFIMPSKFEGFSLSVLEAMAVQLPLLLSDIPSFKEQCEDCALYFDLNDTEDFIEKIKKLQEDVTLRENLAAKGYHRFINNFTYQHYLVNLKQVYLNELHQC